MDTEDILKDERCSLSISVTPRGNEFFEAVFQSDNGDIEVSGFWDRDEALEWLIKRREIYDFVARKHRSRF